MCERTSECIRKYKNANMIKCVQNQSVIVCAGVCLCVKDDYDCVQEGMGVCETAESRTREYECVGEGMGVGERQNTTEHARG